MILLYIILLAFALSSVRFLKKGECWNPDYIGKDTADIVKGICIWLVFIRHILSYMTEIPGLNRLDILLFSSDQYLRQFLVVPFLFYSGYGVTLSLKKKGMSYANSIPAKRVLPTLLNFDVAVCCFLLMNIALGVYLAPTKVLLSFIAWDSIGNSNWYVFCILICYLLSWISYKVANGSKRGMLITLWSGILLYTAVIYFFKGHWWYDTIYAYGAGALFATYKDNIESSIRKNYKLWLMISLIGFVVFYNLPNYFSVATDVASVFLCCLVVLFTGKVRLESRLLTWSGSHLFPLYIYQRLPMVVLSTIYDGMFMNTHPYLYVVCCMVITVGIAAVYMDYRTSYNTLSVALWRKKA